MDTMTPRSEMCVTLSRGLSFRWYWSEAEEQTFFRDMCITLHLDGLNVMPQLLLQEVYIIEVFMFFFMQELYFEEFISFAALFFYI